MFVKIFFIVLMTGKKIERIKRATATDRCFIQSELACRPAGNYSAAVCRNTSGPTELVKENLRINRSSINPNQTIIKSISQSFKQ